MGGGILWEKNLVPKPKYSWWIKDTDTYVEFDRYDNKDKLYKVKDKYIEQNSVGLLIYVISTNRLVDFYKYVGDMWIKTYIIGTDIKNNPQKSLHVSDKTWSDIEPTSVNMWRYSLPELSSSELNTERDNTKMYYYEFPGNTTAAQREEYIDMIAENWNFKY